MERIKFSRETVLAISLIALAVVSRLIPHPPNFSPVTGIALFATARFDNKILAVLVTFIAMIFTDLILGMNAITGFVYLAFASILCLGFYSSKINVSTIFFSSLLFFVLTNLGVWFLYYPHTWEGFVSCFILAIPFYTNTLLGDLFYSAALFFCFSTAKRFFLKPI